MTDKVQKIREAVENRYEYWRKKEFNSHSIESEIRMSECQHLLLMLNSLQEEPVSNPTPNEKMSVERWKEACKAACCDRNYRSYYGLTETRDDYFVDGVQWADEHPKEEPVSEDLEKAAIEAFKQIVDLDKNSFLEIFKAGAKWKEEQYKKNLLDACKKQTEEESEIERDFIEGFIENEHRLPTFDDAIKYGMRLQKEQIMKSAFEIEVSEGSMCPAMETLPVLTNADMILLPEDKFKVGDKVKVVIIKSK